MAARRILILLAVLLGASALAAGLAPPEPRRASTRPTAEATPRVAEPDPDVQVVSTAESDQVIEAEAGRRLRIEVTSSKLGSVQLGEDGPIESVQPDSPARFDVYLDEPGEIDLVMLDPRRSIARVEIAEPRG